MINARSSLGEFLEFIKLGTSEKLKTQKPQTCTGSIYAEQVLAHSNVDT